MKFKTKLITLVVAFLAAISFALPSQVNAANTDMVDTSNHNGLMTYDNYYDMLVHYGVKAVVQKVSEGTTYVDPTAKYNLARVSITTRVIWIISNPAFINRHFCADPTAHCIDS